jgi:phytanoyl-CoA hydroxylase
MITNLDTQTYERDGYFLARGLFTRSEVDAFIDHFMGLNNEGRPGLADTIPDAGSEDPLLRFPRMIQMHREDDVSLRFLIDKRLAETMSMLLGEEPYAVQTMFYFKPPGSRGQALHQDQHFLRVQPGTCMAAWLSLDYCDEENGCLQIVPDTKDLPVLCTVPADKTQSFVDITVPLPPGAEPLPMVMEPGDVLFFNGSVIHGSFPNTSTDRFRRALIGHYIVAEAEKVARFYHPVLRMDGSVVEIEVSPGGGPCGVFKEVKGEAVVEMVGTAAAATMRHG